MPKVMQDLTGRRFERLIVLAQAEDTFSAGQRKRNWLTLCDCGTRKVVGGTVLTTGRTRSCGCLLRETNAKKRVETPAYEAFHTRLRRDVGPATQHRCVDCNGWAEEWSYDHEDPDELVAPSRAGRGIVRYSTNNNHYVPRCRPCHRRFDSK